MPGPDNSARIQDVMTALGVSDADFQALPHMSFQDATRRLIELKATVARNFKRAAFELHPDRNPGDTHKLELFKLLGSVKTRIENLNVREASPPPVQMQVIRIVTWTSNGSTYVSRSATTTGVQAGVPFRVATMRPT